MTQNKMTLDEMMAALAARGHKVDGDRADGCKITKGRWGVWAWKVGGKLVSERTAPDEVSAVSQAITDAVERSAREAADRARAVDFARRDKIAARIKTDTVTVTTRWDAGWTLSIARIEDEAQLRALVAAIEGVLTGKSVRS